MALDKVIQYDSFPDRDGEALVHPASDSLEKTAGEVHPDVQDYLANAPSLSSDKMRLLITALSAFDTFGPNKNGDGFYREDLLNEMDYGSHPQATSGSLEIPMYRSFEYFARPYKHHINNEDSPAYGNIERSFFNPKMDRTELVVILDTNKAPEIARRIRNYEPVSTSMGFRAKYDVCSRCGNRASSRAEYCNHLKNDMLEVKPDGHIIHARNPKGKFFDISFLPGVEPADSTSRAVFVGQLSQDGQSENEETENTEDSEDQQEEQEKEAFQKVAGKLSSEVAEERGLNGEEPLQRKTGEDKKTSAIDKKVDGEVKPEYSGEKGRQIAKVVKALRESEPLMPVDMIKQLSKYPLSEVASSAARCGMTVKPEEAQHIALIRAGAPRLGERLRKLRMMLRPENPEKEIAEEVELSKNKSNPKIIKIIADNKPVANMRSMLRPALMKKIKGILSMDEEEKTAALGPNPYLQHRRPVSSTQAYRMASPKEKKRLEPSPIDADNPEGKLVEYIAQMLRKGTWKGKDDRLPSRAMTRSLRRHPRPARSNREQRQQPRRQRRGRVYVRGGGGRRRQAPPGHSSSMMTAPMMYYMQGVGTHRPIYEQSGMVESAMQKQSSIQKKAYVHIDRIKEKMKKIDNRSDQVKEAVDRTSLLNSNDPIVAEAAGLSLLAEEIE